MENRTCKTCNINKPIVDFYRNGKFYKTNCKDCDKKHSAEYKAKNLDKVREVNRDYGRKNKNKRKEYMKKLNYQIEPYPKGENQKYYLINKKIIGLNSKIKNGKHYENVSNG